jgi:hypothetical protein
MCIRALDYCPPVDITFGEYLRALITADCDLVPDDDRNYRIAFIEAFRSRGIYPPEVRTLSVESLRWNEPGARDQARLLDALPGAGKIKRVPLTWDLRNRTDREEVYKQNEANAANVHGWFKRVIGKGLADQRAVIRELMGLDPRGGDNRFQVHSVRPARRIGPDGQQVTDLIIEVVQRQPAWICDGAAAAVKPKSPRKPDFYFRGGCTMIYSLSEERVRYCVKKSLNSAARLQRQRDFLAANQSLYQSYFTGPGERVREQFALLHRS